MAAHGLSTSRPTTPESPSTSSLYRAMNTIDDLTQALSNFSQVTPDSSMNLTCCCGLSDCENSQAWLELKSQLESRLTLSAEVGQALLQRHEAYIRQHEAKVRSNRNYDIRQQSGAPDFEDDEDETIVFKQEMFDAQYAELFKEKQTLEKRLNQALVNNEVTEVSNKTLLQELNDARATISRLTAHHARSIGWDTRLTAALKERDDMQQERDSESHRARSAESRFEALKDKTVKLQNEVRRLQEGEEEKRSHRLESSLNLLQDARTRLESIRESGQFHTMDGYEEITKILESLVQDNETLKRDNDELQQLLAESREDFTSLQEEYEEFKANPLISRSGANTPNSRHSHRRSVVSLHSRDYSVFTSERKLRRHPDLLIPEPATPLSPTNSLSPPDWRWGHNKTASLRSSSRTSPTRYSVEIEADQDNGDVATEKRRSTRPLLLLSKSRGVQTDSGSQTAPHSSSPMPSTMHSLSPYERSEASSFSESSSVQITSLVERISTLLARMLQTDPLTLTYRLKRQHLQGADIRHLSKSTINSIVSEVNSLRQQYRSLLEEEKTALPVTRKDLRGLFKFFRDVFTELGQVRSVLNEIILDPSMACKISQQALYPEKTPDIDAPANPGTQSWMAPISKLLFSHPRAESPPPSLSTMSSSLKNRNPRFASKSGPALAASATTVNVEFSGVGGRSTTNATAVPISVTKTSPAEGTTALMNIFAGAPQLSNSTSTSTDTWVVVPPREQTYPNASEMQVGQEPEGNHTSMEAYASCTIGRKTALPLPQPEIPRAVDAVIDGSQHQVAPLLQRTLRRRGLSDSSIRTTSTSHGNQSQETSTASCRQPRPPRALADVFKTTWPDSSFVFQALSRTVQNLKLSGSAGSGPPHNSATATVRSRRTVESTSIPSMPSERTVTGNATKSQSQMPGRPRTPNLSKPSSSIVLGPHVPSSTKLPLTTSSQLPNERRPVTIKQRKASRPDYKPWVPAGLMLDSAAAASDPFAVRNVVGSFREESFLYRTPRNGGEI